MRKRPLRRERKLPEPGAATSAERLQKLLANAGLGSRREIEQWIRDGRLQVNGKTAELGQRINPAVDQVQLDRRPLRLASARRATRVLVYNKPEGEVCSQRDPEGRPTVFDRLPRLPGARWISVGRLDVNTSGLLLFTNNGELANKLMHPSSQLERQYLVRVRGSVDDAILARLQAGVQLDDGPAAFLALQRLPRDSASHQWFLVKLGEGRNREVRRLWESQGVQVSRLKRTAYGPVRLSNRLARGRSQEMDPISVKQLLQLVGLQAPMSAQAAQRKNSGRHTGAKRKPSKPAR